MKKISTRNAILAGIFGWVSFLLADSICFTLLTMKVSWQPAAVVSAVIGAMAARWISYSFARSIFIQLSRFWNWLRSVWQLTTMPVGLCVRRTADEVLLMC